MACCLRRDCRAEGQSRGLTLAIADKRALLLLARPDSVRVQTSGLWDCEGFLECCMAGEQTVGQAPFGLSVLETIVGEDNVE